MKIYDFFKGVYRRLFPIRDIQAALNIKLAISEDMVNKIEIWQNCYSGKAFWLDENVCSLHLEQSITREFSNIVLNEMTAKVTNERLNNIFKTAVRDLNINLQMALATGAFVIKPLGEDKVQYVSASEFIPVEFDSRGRLIKVIFPEFKKLGDNYYTRLEFHSLDYNNGLTITNTAYVSGSPGILGREISLESVDEWKDLEMNISFPLMKRPAFGYYRNPIKNVIDYSQCGVSIFNSALELICKTDIQFGRLDWEFKSGERAIYVDPSALKKGKVAKLNKRLYRALDIELENTELFKEFSPQLRQADITAGLEEYKRNIEYAVGLSYGDLSNPQSVAKTATEIKSSKERKYNTVSAIQENLRDCLDDLVYALAFYNSMATSNYKFICDFKDSILTDEETERAQDRQDLANGTLRPEEYRAKWRGEDIDTALENLPKSAEVID